MIQATLLVNKETAFGAELPQVPAKGDNIVFSGMKYQVTKVTWVLAARSDSLLGCSDVMISLRSVA